MSRITPVRKAMACLMIVASACSARLPALEGEVPADAADAKVVAPHPRSSIEFATCPFDAQSIEPAIECGTLRVPAEYNRDTRARVELPFVIVKPLVEPLDTPPLVVAGGGGPGAALGIGADDGFVDYEIWKEWRYSTVDAGRALVLIDNRGVGSATPSLFCPEVHGAFNRTLDTSSAVSDARLANDMLDAYAQCRKRIESDGTRLSSFNVINAARDLEQFRLLNDLPALDLFGASYGSRVAMMYERLFPRTARTLTLDGAYPFTEYGSKVDWQVFDDTFERIFTLCREDARCTRALGSNLEADFHAYLEKLQRQPVRVSVTSTDPIAQVWITVTPAILTSALFSAAYDAATLAQLPFVIRTILSGGTDHLTDTIRDHYYQANLDTSFADAAYYAYACHDSLPFTDHEQLQATFGSRWFAPWFDAEMNLFGPAICNVMGIEPADADILEPHAISSPVLILAGLQDPVTPLSWSQTLADNTDLAWLITFGDIGHYVIGSTWWCADTVLELFLAAPRTRPDDDCLAGAATRELKPGIDATGY